MGSFTITYPDGEGARILDALAGAWDYDEDLHGTKVNFVRNQLMSNLKATILQYEVQQAGREADLAARAAAEAVGEPDLTVTL